MMFFFSSLNQCYEKPYVLIDLNCFSQVSDVAHGPLVLAHQTIHSYLLERPMEALRPIKLTQTFSLFHILPKLRDERWHIISFIFEVFIKQILGQCKGPIGQSFLALQIGVQQWWIQEFRNNISNRGKCLVQRSWIHLCVGLPLSGSLGWGIFSVYPNFDSFDQQNKYHQGQEGPSGLCS